MTKQKKRGGRRNGSGRKPGVPNALTSEAKSVIADTAERLQADGRGLYEWVKKSEDNESAYWRTIYPRLLPVQLNAKVGGDGTPIEHDHTHRLSESAKQLIDSITGRVQEGGASVSGEN